MNYKCKHRFRKGGVRFSVANSVANDGIKAITFSAKNGESLAGKFQVEFDSAPVVQSIS